MCKCKQCNVTLRDDTQICPLCRCVVEQDIPGENTYPDVRFTEKQLKKISNILFFALLLISVSLLTINYSVSHGSWWCIIPIAAMIYAYLILRITIVGESGYRAKIMTLALFTVLLVILIDVLTGFRRWSVNYVFPGGLLLVDATIVVLMVVNLRNWQSYIIFQLGMILLSFAPLLLWRWEIITNPLLSFIALGVSIFLFLGTLIIGDRRARIELRRRFHI